MLGSCIGNAGLVSTYAGVCGEAGDVDGDAEDAMFTEVYDVQCLANCSVLVAEPGSGRIRLVLDSAGDCPVTPAAGGSSVLQMQHEHTSGPCAAIVSHP